MQYRADTPYDIVFEMYVFVLWIPGLAVLLAASAIVAILKCRSARFSAPARWALGLVVTALAVPVISLGFTYGALTILEHPKYRHYVDCDPCF